MTLKRCTKCHQEKPATFDYFAWWKRAEGTFRPQCRMCARAGKKASKGKVTGFQESA